VRGIGPLRARRHAVGDLYEIGYDPLHLGDAASSPATASDSFAEPNHRLRIQADAAA